MVIVVSSAANNAPNVPDGILTALAEEAHTPASTVVVAIPATIARDQPQWGHTARNDDIVVAAKTMMKRTINDDKCGVTANAAGVVPILATAAVTTS